MIINNSVLVLTISAALSNIIRAIKDCSDRLMGNIYDLF